MSSRRVAPVRPRLLWSRWLVLALLSLMLPLQGALAATMGIDMAMMSVPADRASAADAARPDCLGSSASPASSSMTHHGSHAMPHDGAPHAASPQTGSGHGDAHGDGAAMDHSCGICLQCCIGAALPIASLTPAAQDLRDVAPSLGASDVPDPSPRSLDRPPKPSLA